MKFFKIIFLLVVASLISPTLNGGENYRDDCSVENFIEDSLYKFCEVEREIDDEIVLTNSSRRGKSSSESNLVNCRENYLCERVLSKVISNKKILRLFDVYITQNEEISFIHRFQLF